MKKYVPGQNRSIKKVFLSSQNQSYETYNSTCISSFVLLKGPCFQGSAKLLAWFAIELDFNQIEGWQTAQIRSDEQIKTNK
jgi:hypothetical protein